MRIKLLGFLLIALASCRSNIKAKKEMSNDKDTTNVSAANNTEPAQSNMPFPMQTGFSDQYLKATFWKCNYNSAGPQNAYWVITTKYHKAYPGRAAKTGKGWPY